MGIATTINTTTGSSRRKSHTMGRFYFDMEFTNGNYYLVDIPEIALLAEESGNVYQSYVKINYSVPRHVQLLTGITNRTIEAHGVPFRDVMDGLVEFIRREATELPVIIAHGCYVHDFPILLASCMKHNYNDYAACKISRILTIGDPDWTLYVKNLRSRKGDIRP